MTTVFIVIILVLLVRSIILSKTVKVLEDSLHLSENTTELAIMRLNESVKFGSFLLKENVKLKSDLEMEKTGVLYDPKTDSLIPREDMIRVGSY